jgi:hypothetical protein
MHYVGTTVAVFTKFACIHLQGEMVSSAPLMVLGWLRRKQNNLLETG